MYSLLLIVLSGAYCVCFCQSILFCQMCFLLLIGLSYASCVHYALLCTLSTLLYKYNCVYIIYILFIIIYYILYKYNCFCFVFAFAKCILFCQMCSLLLIVLSGA